MSNVKLSFLAFNLLVVVFMSCLQNVKNPQGAYKTGIYQNLFVELLGKDGAEVQAKVDQAWNQLFGGDSLSQRLYYTVDPDMAFIIDTYHNEVRSEGQSYGMMIAVQMDKKPEFDRMWKWAKTCMQHSSGPNENYFAWQVKTDGTVMDPNSASDGEEYFIMALLFAAARWGNGSGIFDYQSEAQIILDAMLHKENSPDPHGIRKMFDPDQKQVVFSPIGTAAAFTDPSYHLPAFYELWAAWARRDNAFWAEAATVSRQFFKKTVHPVTGLAPDYAHFDGSPVDPWGGKHDDFRFDAWRVAMNIAMDYAWFAQDPWQVQQSNRLLDFFYSQGLDAYGNQYTLDGKKLSEDHSPGHVAMNAVACLAATTSNKKAFIQEFWDLPVPGDAARYYDGMLYMLGLLHVSGNFRIYTPASAASKPAGGRP